MIWKPTPGQKVTVNYKDKTMVLQGLTGSVVAASAGKGPHNALVKFIGIHTDIFEVIPRGNLNEIKEG